jgi:Glycosyl hydrolases family 43
MGVTGVLTPGVRPAEAQVLPRTSPGAITPVYDADAPDPDVIRVGTTYYAYTTGSVLENIPVLMSSDLQTWSPVGDALPTLPLWSEWGRTWSPGVVSLNGQYVMFYATEVAATGQRCISTATASSPTGPFNDSSLAPLICQTSMGGSIDPQPFVDVNGTPYLYWKSNAGLSSAPASIWATLLSPDGLSLASSPRSVLSQDQPWESTVEGPDMVDASGSYVLFYSGGAWNSPGYGVGYAECAGPFGPCTKPKGAPILHSDSARLGPGGESLFQDPSGNWWMAYHAWDGPVSDYSYSSGAFRSLWIAPVTFSGATPTVEAGESPEGYHLFARDGGVFTFGAARFAGSMGATALRGPVVEGASDSATGGYWEVGGDGTSSPSTRRSKVRWVAVPSTRPSSGWHRHPTATAIGSWALTAGSSPLATPGTSGLRAAGTSTRPSSGWHRHPTAAAIGSWALTAGSSPFGDAPFSGSMGGQHLDAPVVEIAAMPQGGGYWLVGADGGIFAFGDAPFYGSMGGQLIGRPVVGMVAGPGSGGYWLIASDGGVFSYGDAAYLGSMGAIRLAAPVVGGSTP